jgi:peptidoglycan/xylan/chitin deacetylase (PgdA/CDA1 family)
VNVIENRRNVHAVDNTTLQTPEQGGYVGEDGAVTQLPETEQETEATKSETGTTKKENGTTKKETTSRAPATEPPKTTEQGQGNQGHNGKGKVIYLTFDDGPTAVTDDVLTVLDRYKVKATFFVIYQKGGEERLREIQRRGHTIGLHSYSHKYNEVYASTDAFFEDLQKVSDYVEGATGIKSKLIRFPGGSSNEVSKKYSPGIMTKLVPMVKEKGYVYFDWNCENGDANGNNISPRSLVEKTIKTAPKSANHICVLMHDGPGKKTTAQALPGIIEYFRDAGYAFESLNMNSYAVHHAIHN